MEEIDFLMEIFSKNWFPGHKMHLRYQIIDICQVIPKNSLNYLPFETNLAFAAQTVQKWVHIKEWRSRQCNRNYAFLVRKHVHFICMWMTNWCTEYKEILHKQLPNHYFSGLPFIFELSFLLFEWRPHKKLQTR